MVDRAQILKAWAGARSLADRKMGIQHKRATVLLVGGVEQPGYPLPSSRGPDVRQGDREESW